jgi:hypothetical protein
MHFSQGWVQFVYRFSFDFVPWALVLVAIGLVRVAAWARPRAGSRLGPVGGGTGTLVANRSAAAAALAIGGAVALVVASVLVNAWGVIWGDALGW